VAFLFTDMISCGVWQDYPETDWGERAFVLLLERAWDTWPGCSKGSDQFREVIQHGEAYATWWSLSKDVPSDYVDPNQYQIGSEEALQKSLAYFEQVIQISPGTSLADYAAQVLSGLRERKVIDPYWFYCVYD